MRTNAALLWVLTGFFALSAVVYTAWNFLDGRGIEWVGTIAILLSAIMSGFIGFYVARSHAAQGGELPEDRLDSDIDDGDPELGFFSPYSWWPLVLGAAAGLGVLGFAVGFWVVFIAGGLGAVGLVGWVYEYYRGNFGH